MVTGPGMKKKKTHFICQMFLSLNLKILKYLTKRRILLIKLWRLQYFPLQWKAAQFILIQKPGKALQLTSSYRPISPLPILSKDLEICWDKTYYIYFQCNLATTIFCSSVENSPAYTFPKTWQITSANKLI